MENELRKYKWSAIRGIAGVGAFALSTKLISIPVLNFLVGIIAASPVSYTHLTLPTILLV